MNQVEIIADIRNCHRQRQFAMELRKMVDLKLGAFVRRQLGWQKDLPEAEREAISAQSAAMLKDMDGPYADIIASTMQYRGEFQTKIELPAKKEMARLAKKLPVWEAFGNEVCGFGAVGLAVIVAEAGDLSNYDSEAKLWKRMGLAPGQGRVPKGLTREATKQAWIDRGYSPKRRSHMWNIGEALIKTNGDGKYRTMYLARKVYLQIKAAEKGLIVAPAADIPKGRNAEFVSQMQIHRQAQHYMEKRLLRDLWRAWRGTKRPVSETTKQPVSHASNYLAA
jgi:hypothetical protein